jgi:hypothetical protein
MVVMRPPHPVKVVPVDGQVAFREVVSLIDAHGISHFCLFNMTNSTALMVSFLISVQTVTGSLFCKRSRRRWQGSYLNSAATSTSLLDERMAKTATKPSDHRVIVVDAVGRVLRLDSLHEVPLEHVDQISRNVEHLTAGRTSSSEVHGACPECVAPASIPA